MSRFEYRVIPAPKQGLKAKGLKSTEAQFAHALTTVMNAAAADGWDYQRTDTLPCEERSGLTGRTTVFQNMLVFRRITAEAAAVDLRAAAATADAQRAATSFAAMPANRVPSVGEASVIAAPVTTETRASRVLQTLATGTSTTAPVALTPDLRADPQTRVAAE